MRRFERSPSWDRAYSAAPQAIRDRADVMLEVLDRDPLPPGDDAVSIRRIALPRRGLYRAMHGGVVMTYMLAADHPIVLLLTLVWDLDAAS